MLDNDCWQVLLNFGFKDEPDVPLALGRMRAQGCPIDDMDTSYFLSRDIVIPTLGSGMSDWREKLFAGMHRNAFRRLPISCGCRLTASSSSARRSNTMDNTLARTT